MPPTDLILSATKWIPVTPSDTVDFDKRPRAIYVGGAGNVAAVGQDGVVATFSGATAGNILPIMPKRINQTNTTATLILALY